MGLEERPLFKLENGQVIKDDGEFDVVRPYCEGHGLNLGCGIRQPNENMFRVSLGDHHNGFDSPQMVVDFNGELPWDKASFNYVFMSHSLEHAADVGFTLNEARRVAINHVVVVWPDSRWTAFDRDHILLTGTELLLAIIAAGFEIVFAAETQPNWSYGVVYK
jgi:hypothetical protein